MAGCRFNSPELVTSLPGVAASPTFAFDATNTAYLGLAGSFTSNNGAACSFPTRYVTQQRTSTYAITPLIVATGRTTTCSILAPPSITPGSGGSTTYSGFECPSVTGNSLAPGTYTLRFSQPANVGGAPSISSRLFIIASPTFMTDRVTATIIQTETASGADPTATVTEFTSTATVPGDDQTVTETSTGTTTATTTVTDFECPPTASSSTSSAASTPTGTLPVSPNGQCGDRSGQTCSGSTFGRCCSAYGWCGSSDAHCLTTEGCQPGFGDCTIPSPVSSTPPAPTPTSNVSTDGTCGGTQGFVCTGSIYGDCCSPYGWCGDAAAHCGPGCQIAFGTCPVPSPTGTAPVPTSTLPVTLDGRCGETSGQTCAGSSYGDCCSAYGYCGRTASYCTAGCQPIFGTCSVAVARVRRSGALLRERAIGGAGPDYTYPPIPRTTVTSTTTQSTTVTASAPGTTTVGGVVTTTVGGEVTVTTSTFVAGTTVTATTTQTGCSTAL
ncbi:carbohydrate-binding module family 18 protein [Dothidotthia symphoricarpi CBS 119687]|uniref:Carbohydrate-binding module family 18 protein n=1 Tax=Dothidotthia symphoricarpi CBS 119687 TaxID=1392245 RepID=A0A6A6AJ47_9PLEO|nr:carbohydrate-binding module family 18 protein [Dothidotthia symphoricarpi CBS 119687]KAF2130461.1 carbohydrate-binding module family 18 protein [Dothidotthia symphoricarpi CBS 119687]